MAWLLFVWITVGIIDDKEKYFIEKVPKTPEYHFDYMSDCMIALDSSEIREQLLKFKKEFGLGITIVCAEKK